jgi:hypothetical protein
MKREEPLSSANTTPLHPACIFTGGKQGISRNFFLQRVSHLFSHPDPDHLAKPTYNPYSRNVQVKNAL